MSDAEKTRKPNGMNRRDLFRRTATAAGAVAGAHLLRPFNILGQQSPNEQLGTAVIGAWGRGRGHLGAAAGERLIAVVDVDEGRLGKAAEQVSEKAPDVKKYTDYRKMFDEVGGDLDAVFVATPDHTHAHAAMMAIERGMGVYVEKPMTRSIYESRALTEAVQQYGVASQLGNQGHSGEGYRRLCEYIWAGAIGDVTEIHCWTDRHFGGSGGRPESKPVPEGLHWDQWIGPRPYREYHTGLHSFNWRSWWDFGAGSLGDMGCHVADGAFWALKIREADSYSVTLLSKNGGSEEMYPVDNLVRWDIPARAGMPAAKVFWHDGVGKEDRPDPIARVEKEYERNLGGSGTLYFGTEGIMYTGCYGGGVRIIPEEQHRATTPPEEKIPRVRGGHQGDFLRSCKGGERASSHFGYSGPLTEWILTGLLATRAGLNNTVEWDVKNTKCLNRPELNDYVKPEFRKGWEI